MLDQFGLVAAHPFLDHRLIELVFSAPIDMLVKPAVAKPLLLAALGDLLPRVVARRKHGADYQCIVDQGMSAEGPRIRRMFTDALV